MAVCSLLWLSVRLGTRLRYKLSRRDQRRGFQPQRFSRTAREFPAQSAYLQSIPPSAKTMSTYLTPSSSRSVHPCLCQLIYCSTAYSQAHVCQSTLHSTVCQDYRAYRHAHAHPSTAKLMSANLQYAKLIAPTAMPIHLQPSSCPPIYSMPSLSRLQPWATLIPPTAKFMSIYLQPSLYRLQTSWCPLIYCTSKVIYPTAKFMSTYLQPSLYRLPTSWCPLIYIKGYLSHSQVHVHLSTAYPT